MNYETGELLHSDMERLSAILGGPEHAAMAEESEFLALSGCPSMVELESWLKRDFVQHDIDPVLAGTEKAGPDAIILVRQYDDFFSLRLFTPSQQLLRASHEISELRQMWDQGNVE